MFDRPLDLEAMVLTAKGINLKMRSKIQAHFVRATQGGRYRLQIKVTDGYQFCWWLSETRHLLNVCHLILNYWDRIVENCGTVGNFGSSFSQIFCCNGTID